MGLEDVCIFGANFLEAEVRRIKKYIFFSLMFQVLGVGRRVNIC